MAFAVYYPTLPAQTLDSTYPLYPAAAAVGFMQQHQQHQQIQQSQPPPPSAVYHPTFLPMATTSGGLTLRPQEPPLSFDFSSFLPPAYYPHLPLSPGGVAGLPTSPYPPSDYTPSPPSSLRVAECKDWLKGRCLRGVGCRFHHSQLHSLPSNSSLPTSPLPPFLSTQSYVTSPQPLPHLLGAAMSPSSPYPSFPTQFPSFPSPSSSQPSSPYPSTVYPPFPQSGGSFPSYHFPSYTNPPFSSPTSFTSPSSFSHPSYHSPDSSSSTVSSPSPVPTPRTSSDLCRDFQHGVCFRGQSCRFLHEKQICGDWIHGKCTRGDGCKFSHDKKAGPACRDFVQGRCSRGEDCRYWHGEQEGMGGMGGECRDWMKGRCARGSSCKFSHQPQRSSPHGGEEGEGRGVGAVVVGTRRAREPPPQSSPNTTASSSAPQTIDVTVDSSIEEPLSFTVERNADAHHLHITVTQDSHKSFTTETPADSPSHPNHQIESAKAKQEEEEEQGGSKEEQAGGSKANDGDKKTETLSHRQTNEKSDRGEDSEEQERQINGDGQHITEDQKKQDKEAGAKQKKKEDKEDRIDQTDGAADGDMYLSDERPTKKRRSNGPRDRN